MAKKEEKIYVVGHKNPDTDSICSAIAYADIKNRTNAVMKYIARRERGRSMRRPWYVLNRFGVQAAGIIWEISVLQVKDMDIRTRSAGG